MMQGPQSWSLVIFCYNEFGTLPRVIEEALAAGKHLNPHDFEVLIVDDGCTDGSSQIMDKYAAQYPEVRIARHPKNRGIGYALTTGYQQALGENICAIPADGQFNVQELYPFKEIAENEVISFYRPVKQGYSAYRNILNWFNFASNKYMLGLNLKDVNWVKAYKKQHLKDIPLDLTSSLLESELCAKLCSRGVLFKEYPSDYLIREYGVPKGGSLKTMSSAALEFFKLIYTVNKYRFGKQKQLYPAQ